MYEIDVQTEVQFHRKHLRRLTSFLPPQRPARHHSRPAAAKSPKALHSSLSQTATKAAPRPSSRQFIRCSSFQANAKPAWTISSMRLVTPQQWISCKLPSILAPHLLPFVLSLTRNILFSYQVCDQRECFLERHRVTVSAKDSEAFARKLQRTCVCLLPIRRKRYLLPAVPDHSAAVADHSCSLFSFWV